MPRNPSEYNGFPEYLVKWEGLPYSECTWEDGQLITNKFKAALEDYNFRQKSQKVPSKVCKVCGNLMNQFLWNNWFLVEKEIKFMALIGQNNLFFLWLTQKIDLSNVVS